VTGHVIVGMHQSDVHTFFSKSNHTTYPPWCYYSENHHTTMESPNAYPNGSRIWFFGTFEVMYGTVIETVCMADGTQCVTIRVDGELGRPRTLPVATVHGMPPGH